MDVAVGITVNVAVAIAVGTPVVGALGIRAMGAGVAVGTLLGVVGALLGAPGIGTTGVGVADGAVAVAAPGALVGVFDATGATVGVLVAGVCGTGASFVFRGGAALVAGIASRSTVRACSWPFPAGAPDASASCPTR